MKLHRLLCALAPFAVFAPALAQTKYAVSPAGFEWVRGGSANTFPLGSVSASYQQIHDSVDMEALNGGAPLILSGMDFRPANAYVIAARSIDVQITLSVTSVSAATMSKTFSANFGPASTVVLPYTNLNLPAGAGTNGNPNPPLWKFPFKSLFAYTPVTGNLLWDWRHKNSTSGANSFFDFQSGTKTAPIIANAGTGCTATGRTSPALASITPSGTNYVLGLTQAPSNTAAFMGLGISRSPVPLACGTLYVIPALILGGVTDSVGAWNPVTFPSTALSFTPHAETYAQFVFADAGLPAGLGLSNYAVGGSPPNGLRVSRLWSVSSTNGAETATSGSGGVPNGLVTMFTIL